MMGNVGGVFPGMGAGSFNVGMPSMPLHNGMGGSGNAGTGLSTGSQARNGAGDRGRSGEFYAGSIPSGPFDGMNLMHQNGMPVQMSAPQWLDSAVQSASPNQNAQQTGQAGSSGMRHPFVGGTSSSPVTTPLASGRANLPQAQPGGSSNRSMMGSPANQYISSPVTASYAPPGVDQNMDYGSIAMRLNQQNQQNRVTGNGAGMAPRPSANQTSFPQGNPFQSSTPVAPSWGHIGLPEPSPANTPHLGTSSQNLGPTTMDWTDSSRQSRRSSGFNTGMTGPDLKVERPGRQSREIANKSGTVTPVLMEHPGPYGTMSVPTSPEKRMNAPGGHQAGLISGVENALADLNTGAGHGLGIGPTAARSRKKNASASSSRVNSPDRKRKAAPVFSYSGALSALNSRAGSPTAEHDGPRHDIHLQSLSHVDMHAVGQALRADESVNETPTSDPLVTVVPGSSSAPNVANDAGFKGDYRKRKRNRTIQSCLPCHQNKRKVIRPACYQLEKTADRVAS